MSVIETIKSDPALYITIVTVIALQVGSFLNVVIHRLPVMMKRQWRGECLEFLEQQADENETKYNLATPRSACPECNHTITALENIPLLSYLFLKGKCSGCGTRISPRYPLVEFTTALLSGLMAWHFGFTVQLGFSLVLLWSLIALTMIDFDEQLLPDSIVMPLLWLGLLGSLWKVNGIEPSAAIIGAAVGYLSLWSIYHLFRIITGKEGMGYGDFKLLAVLGAWMGWEMIPLIVILSSIAGAVVGSLMIAFKLHERGKPIPYGPWLAIAGLIAFIWGNGILDIYLHR